MFKTLVGALAGIFAAVGNASYIDNKDGTFTDTHSGLTWMRCAAGQTWDALLTSCSGTAAGFTWSAAMTAPQGFADQSDWRLPNVRELYSLIDYTKNRPAFDNSIILGVVGNEPYWSSTEVSDGPGRAMTVRFWDGGFDKYGDPRLDKTSQAMVRYVRGQETSSFMKATRVDAIYSANPDGSVLDKTTGLTWQPCLVGQTWSGGSCIGGGTAFAFSATQSAASANRFGGFSDWRVPTIEELLSLVNSARAKPAMNLIAFPSAVTGALWSRSVNAGNSGYAWYLDFDYGAARTWSTASYAYGMRLVRGGGRFGAYPGTAVIVRNPYGTVSVSGAVLANNVISNFTEDVAITFGSIDDGSSPSAEIDFNGLSLGAGRSLRVQVDGSGKAVTLRNIDNTMSRIDGVLSAPPVYGQAPPSLIIQNRHGIETGPVDLAAPAAPSIVASGGLTLDTRGSVPYTGGDVLNGSIVDGGKQLTLLAGRVQRGGAYMGDAVMISTFDRANNPVNGAFYLDNSIHVFPSTGTDVALTLNHYGPNPNYLNIYIEGNVRLTMPSVWQPGTSLPRNNLPVLPGTARAMTDPPPTFGGGSLIVQASKNLTLQGGPMNDFVFPGGIVLKAGGTIDLAGVTLVNGWTTAGKPFQGLYFEAPAILTPSLTYIYTNDLNWTNFSVMPIGHFRFFSLKGGGAYTQYVASDSDVPHLNAYSFLIDLAARGLPWVSYVNTAPIEVH